MKNLILLLIFSTPLLYGQVNRILRQQDLNTYHDTTVVNGEVDANFDSLYGYWVNKHEAQTITGQKNFMGGAKFGQDTLTALGGTLNWLGYIKPISLNIKMKDELPNVHTIFSVSSTDSYTGNFGMYCKEFDFQEGIPGVGLGWYNGYNIDGAKPDLPVISQAFEPNFEASTDSVDILYEYHITVQDKALNPTFSTRPLYLGYAPYNNNRIFMFLATDNLMLMNRNQDINFNFVFDTDAVDSIPHLDIGKSGFIHFSGGTGSSIIKVDRVGSANPVDILALNGSDEVQLAPFEGAHIRLGQGWLATGEGGNAGLSIGGIGVVDASSFWIRSETGASRAFITSSGLVIGNSFPNFWGTGNVIAAKYYATNSTGGAYQDNTIFYSTDLTDGNTIPSFYTEGTGVITALGNIANRYNGTVRYFPSSTTDDAWMKKGDSTLYATQTDIAGKSDVGHTHTEFFDTLSFSWGLGMGNSALDTITTGTLPDIKLPNNITITEITGYTNTGTVTFNIEIRGETTPNTAGTDIMASDLVADNDQQEQTSFSQATATRNQRLTPTISAVASDPTLFGITVRYVKTN